MMKPPISLEQIEYMRLPPSARNSTKGYLKYRISRLKRGLKEAKNRHEFNDFEDFLFGRLTEVQNILDMILYLEKRKTAKKVKSLKFGSENAKG